MLACCDITDTSLTDAKLTVFREFLITGQQQDLCSHPGTREDEDHMTGVSQVMSLIRADDRMVKSCERF